MHLKFNPKNRKKMTKFIVYLAIALSLLLTSCNTKPNLQNYFVNNQEKQGFIAFDISPSILNVDKTKLSVDEKTTIESFEKMNVLAFKIDNKNKSQYTTEKEKVRTILKDTTNYHQLMKFGMGSQGVSVSYVGTDDNIKEFIVFGNKDDSGFGLVRVLGNNMKPENAMNLISILKNSKIDTDQFKVLKDIIK